MFPDASFCKVLRCMKTTVILNSRSSQLSVLCSFLLFARVRGRTPFFGYQRELWATFRFRVMDRWRDIETKWRPDCPRNGTRQSHWFLFIDRLDFKCSPSNKLREQHPPRTGPMTVRISLKILQFSFFHSALHQFLCCPINQFSNTRLSFSFYFR